MNLSHLKTTLWLRWRILANRIRRTGKLGNALYALVLFLAIAGSIAAFGFALGIGINELPDAPPRNVMFVWVGIVGAFLLSWMVGVITDLQRADSMSFDNLLHLPVSLSWIFLCNYMGSFVSLTSIFFMPMMLGLSLAMVIVHGPSMLLSIALVLGFFLMTTAVTYQFRGWLGRLMRDKRRGRNIIAALTVGLVLLLQLPNIANLTSMKARSAQRKADRVEQNEIAHDESIDEEERRSRNGERLERKRTRKEEKVQQIETTIQRVCLVAPPGWLPSGVRAALDGRWLSGSLFALGMFALGALSLRRSYTTTLLAVTGGGGSNAPPDQIQAKAEAASGPRVLRGRLVAWKLPFGTEGFGVIALASLRALLRAPEAKMMLLSPVLLLGMGGIMLNSSQNLVKMAPFAPFMTLGAALLGMFSIMQLIQNQFGLDRTGFRSYVLSPVPRHEILAGKNLSLAPLGVGIGFMALVGLRVFVPFSTEILFAGFVQLGSSFLLLCLVGNMISIYGPMRLQDHGMRAADLKLRAALWQFVSILLCPLVLLPLTIPGWVVRIMSWRGIETSIPVFFLLHVICLALVWFLYRWVVKRQGELLQGREQNILEVLTRR